MARSRSCLASSTPRFEAASISMTSSAVCPLQILAQLSHSPQGSPDSSRTEQLRAIASIRASVVLPTPRGPQKRYACPTRLSDTARRSVSETCCWVATSANRRGRYFRANAVWDNVLKFRDRWCGSRHAATCGTRPVETPHEKQKKCPRRPAATITTLTAATGKVLTELVGFRPTDLGHLKLRP